jgi:hypothetical protein
MGHRFNKNVMSCGVASIALFAATLPAFAQTAAPTQAAPATAAPMAQSTPPATPTPSRPVSPNAGNLDPFGGNLDPFGGNIDPFGGNIDPFGGNIDPFGGNIDPFGGNLDPFKDGQPLTLKMLGDFWKAFGTDWKIFSDTLNQLRANPNDATARATAANKLQALVTQSENFWGQRVKKKTGKAFRESFANPLLAKYGLSLTDSSSFSRLSAANQARFIFEWYDGLNGFTGIDQVDHWMRAVNWNPGLTKVQGNGRGSTIGIIDGRIGKDAGLSVTKPAGYDGTDTGHGAAVLSLITAAHDGAGVQGIAPEARVIAYNPFDGTGTASWADIRDGIAHLQKHKASVINLSLGERGFAFSPGWQSVFSSQIIRDAVGRSIYVVAAGNEGASQSANVALDNTSAPAILIVGSVDTRGVISSFSNRPGTACFTVGGVCNAGQLLQDRFLVAPGELLLVSNGQGGVTRVSGTSFSAPLVSGAITLLHDRWPWLVNHPTLTANIILSTARDLGAPGTDPVYGRGMLDVEASQAPINFANVLFYETSEKSKTQTARTAQFIQSRSLPSNFEVDGLFYYLIENLGASHRDFAVPLAKRLHGQRTKIGGSEEYFQDYVARRLDNWIKKSRGGSLTDLAVVNGQTSSGLHMSFAVAPRYYGEAQRNNLIAMSQPNVRLSSAEGRFGISFGYGQGARTLAQQSGFGLYGDYEADNGGIDPMLGLASGGAYMMGDVKLADNLTASIGYTENRRAIENSIALERSEREMLSQYGVNAYKANGQSIKLQYAPLENVNISLSYARIGEDDALFGVQSLENSDLRHGAQTQTGTLGFAMQMPRGFNIAASATVGRTATGGGSDRALRSAEPLLTSSFAVAATKRGVLGKADILRLSVMQPLTVQKGGMLFNSVQVIDRQTGELGEVTQRFSIADRSRRFNGEIVYATPVLSNGEFGLFGRAEFTNHLTRSDTVDGLVIGSRLSIAF